MEHWSVLGVSDQVKHKPSAIDCSTKSRLLVIRMSVSKGLVLRYKNTSGLASRYIYVSHQPFCQGNPLPTIIINNKTRISDSAGDKNLSSNFEKQESHTDQRKSVFRIFVQVKHKPSYLGSKKVYIVTPRG